jgi:uncharacterized protein YjiS (DUF1127 family)
MAHEQAAKTATSRIWGPAQLFAFIQRANRVARERRALLHLGDMALKDFGASRADAWNEAGKPWWDLPDGDRRAG